MRKPKLIELNIFGFEMFVAALHIPNEVSEALVLQQM